MRASLKCEIRPREMNTVTHRRGFSQNVLDGSFLKRGSKRPNHKNFSTQSMLLKQTMCNDSVGRASCEAHPNPPFDENP